jgi:hydrogenase maturation protein HypF
MLPYTPLHYLFFSTNNRYPASPYSVLVMTSANYRGNPILTENQQVREQLKSVADAYLFHNREIHIHCDDTVARSTPIESEKPLLYPIRRSRGYSPFPLNLPASGKPALGVGAELKNTFCLTKENYAFLSQHIGDLKNYQTLQSFEKSIHHFENLFRIQPELIAHDLHPNYLSTRYALARCKGSSLETVPVQHHHAHIAACLADNLVHGNEPVIGVAFDGIGYGDDGAIWGGEFLIADYHGYQRVGQVSNFLLPGGDLAIQQPWRSGLSLLDSCGIPWEPHLPAVSHADSLEDEELLPGVSALDVVKNQLETGTNSPQTSSMGRLFDAVASLAGICQTNTYEGQAAIELEALADPGELGSYPVEISEDNLFLPEFMLREVLKDVEKNLPLSTISARFHNCLAEMVLEMSLLIRKIHGLNTVALSGGVWQNMTLLQGVLQRLQAANFQVYIHQRVPTNDGGLALGQVAIGQAHLSV